MRGKLIKVTFRTTFGEVYHFATRHERLSDLIRSVQLPLGYSCSGRGVCAACLVQVEGVGPATNPREVQLLKTVAQDPTTTSRLACFLKLESATTVSTTYW